MSRSCQHFEFDGAPEIASFQRLEARRANWKTVLNRQK